MQAVPHAGVVPFGKPPPARHARAGTHLPRKVLPGNAGLQHERDAGQDLPVGNALTPWVAVAPLHGGQLGLDAGPQVI